jgi:hypothetical protein
MVGSSTGLQYPEKNQGLDSYGLTLETDGLKRAALPAQRLQVPVQKGRRMLSPLMSNTNNPAQRTGEIQTPGRYCWSTAYLLQS